MSDQILFDKLAYIDRLKRAGITEDQARAHAEAMGEALRESVATKSDVLAVRTDMQTIKTDLQREILALRTDFQRDLLALEHRLTVRGGLMAAAVVAILASIKYFG